MACGTPVVAIGRPGAARGRRRRRGLRRTATSPTRSGTALADRDRLVAAGLERAKAFSWDETARRTLDVYREALGVISAIVVSHGHRAELAESLPALAPQVDEIVLIANIPGSLPDDARGAPVIENRAAALATPRT